MFVHNNVSSKACVLLGGYNAVKRAEAPVCALLRRSITCASRSWGWADKLRFFLLG